jgi:uncharacterized protein
MNIYIAQYSEVKYDKTICPISISPDVPAGWNGQSLAVFFPPANLKSQFKSGNVSTVDYTNAYESMILNKLNQKDIIEQLFKLCSPKDVVICCWGTEDTFCHRYLVARWLNDWISVNPETYNLSLVRDYKFRNLANESQR